MSSSLRGNKIKQIMQFDMDLNQRKAILDLVFEELEKFYQNTKDFRITPQLDKKNIQRYISQKNLEYGLEAEEAIKFVTKGLEQYSVHTPHPKYFGLFNPRANYAGIMADLITAAYNPQLAAWSHAPFAVEVELKVIKALAKKFGLSAESSNGVFTSGGAEANLTAILAALNHKYPDFARNGIFGIGKRPIIFCSAEAHHSIQKAAKVIGLGFESVKAISVNNKLEMDMRILKRAIQQATEDDLAPLMVIGTGGTTGTGAIDDLNQIGKIARDKQLWFHVDAAYGGAAILSRRLKKYLKGVEQADSITFDAHKWMSVPMGASIFITSHNQILGKTFRITTEYMPRETNDMDVFDPYTHSIQWSRRFIGLKVYLSLLFYGWNGYEKVIDHQTSMGYLLREKLRAHGWDILNKSDLPIVCFTDPDMGDDPNFTITILKNIIEKGESWLSIYPIKGVNTFRACITNYNTQEQDLDELIAELNRERKLLSSLKMRIC